MESATTRKRGGGKIRIAVQNDRGDITQLLRRADFLHIHADWRLPVDWLGSAGFAVFEERQQLLGCLAVTPDPAPSSWVRVAALNNVRPVVPVLDEMFAIIQPYLRAADVCEVAWMTIDRVMRGWMPQLALGFTNTNWVETYVRESQPLPGMPVPAGVIIRPVTASDFQPLVAVEAAAFAPIWRHSYDALIAAHLQSISFDVIEFEGTIAGFQYSTRSADGAHLARITIVPELQGRGLGHALLAHTLQGYARRGIRTASLNTQADNVVSKRLYERFGFHATGFRVPVWVATLI